MRFSSRFRCAVLGIVSLVAAASLVSAQSINSSTNAAAAADRLAANSPALIDAPAPANDPQPNNSAQPTSANQSGNISGTVTDTNGDLVTGVNVVLEGPTSADRQVQTLNDSGFFNFTGLKPSVAYRVTVSGVGVRKWISQPIVLKAGEFFDVTGIKLTLTGEDSSVTVYATREQIATQQVEIAEHQRVLGFIPNFYVVYDSKNAVPLTTKLKFQLAYKTSIDPVTILGSAFIAGIDQAADQPGYQQGLKGYGQRFGQNYADGLTDILIGGAILPSLLHQDPRYYYQGTGTAKSRALHAVSYAFVCKGDNGHMQPNYSTIGGDVASSALSNLYYPESDRGWGPTLQSIGISTAERMVANLFQEFVVRKLTPSAKRNNSSSN